MQLWSDGGRAGGLSKAFLLTDLMGDMVAAGEAAVSAKPLHRFSLCSLGFLTKWQLHTQGECPETERERVSGRSYITSYDLALEFTELLCCCIHKVQPRFRARRQTPPLVAGVTKF